MVSLKANIERELSYLSLKQEVTLKLPAKLQNYPVLYFFVKFTALHTAVSVKIAQQTLLQAQLETPLFGAFWNGEQVPLITSLPSRISSHHFDGLLMK